ncbi:unnamed protein product [Prorocentrum cordatum]|uniref:Uncharacterized protein n=1 Tax=Prorocentrum cordatum TaxID=2364126 RepID=A0ABN9UCW0_9DINO|nr:unnamed protein product [Polarella glacialis]
MPSASSTARCQQPRRKTGDVVGHDWSKLVIRQADSDRTSLRREWGLHYEQLDRQRPRGPELAGPSEAPHLRLRTLRAETATSGEALDRCLRRNALAGDLGPMYAYKVEYTCSTCGSEWLLEHDWWWSAGAAEPVSGFEGEVNDSLVECFRACRTQAGALRILTAFG